ncbi:unnamed protein product [Calypogeia fissa]
MDTLNFSVEYRELLEVMTRHLNEGCEPNLVALNALKNARKALEHVRSSSKVTRKRKYRGGDDMKWVRHNTIVAIWKQILSPYTQPKQVDGFEKEFTRYGLKG